MVPMSRVRVHNQAIELHRGAPLAIAPVFKDRVYKELSSVLNRYVYLI